MIKLSIPALVCLIANSLSAQITIDEMNMPQANMVYQYSVAANNANDQTMVGEGITWDYSDLVELVEANDTTIDVENAQGIFQLVFNNPILFADYASDYYTSGQGFDLGALSVEDVSNFYQVNSNSFEQTGFGALLNGAAAPITYNPKDVIYELPLNYGDLTDNYAYFEADVPTLGFWSEDIYRINEVEGWGNLILPSGTFEVLKVKTTINRTDSIFVEFIGFGTNFEQPETIEYKWLSSSEMVEVLRITEVLGQVTEVRFFNDSEVISSIEGIEEGAIAFYPNPANDHIFFRNNLNIYSVQLLNNLGQIVLSKRDQSFIKNINVQAIPNGVYHLLINETINKTCVVKHP